MADIRINDLPNEETPNPSEFLAVDGASTRKTTIQSAVNSGAPVSSQAQAQSGTDNNARMTPLSTKQSIASEVGVTIASKASGDFTNAPICGNTAAENNALIEAITTLPESVLTYE